MNKQDLEIRIVWLSEQDRIASFHPVEGYKEEILNGPDAFTSFLLLAIEREYRFQ